MMMTGWGFLKYQILLTPPQLLPNRSKWKRIRGQSHQEKCKEKERKRIDFKKYCREQVEPSPKEGWSSTVKMPWRKDADLVTKVDKYLEISRSQAAAWWRQLRRSYGMLENIKVAGDSEFLLTNLDNRTRAWFNISTDQAISNVREEFEVEREDYPDELEIIVAIFSQ